MSYIFSLDGFRIDHTRARNKDSDVASAALVDATKDPILPTVTRDLGDVDNTLYNGEHTLGILLGPVDINGPVAFSFSITNSGFDRSDTPVARVVTDTIADVAFQAGGAVVGAILGGVLGAGVAAGAGALLADAVKLLDPIIFVNCDGPVAIDGIGVTPELLSNWTANGPHRETNHYTFKSQNGCFGSPQYDVTWSLVRWDGAWAGWSNLGNGFATMSMAATSFRDQLHAFAIGTADDHRGTNLKIYGNTSPDSRNWGDWTEIPGGGLTTLPVATTVFDDRLFLFSVGGGSRLQPSWNIYTNVFDGQNWSGWNEMGGGDLTHLPLAAVTLGSRLLLFNVGSAANDGRIYVNTSEDGQNWSGWVEVGGDGRTALPVAATVLGNRVFVFAIGAAYVPYVNTSEDGQNWSGWKVIPGVPKTDLPMAATTCGGRIYLFTPWPLIEFSRLLGYPRVFPFGDFALGNRPERIYRALESVSANGEDWSGAQEVAGSGLTRVPFAATDFGGQPFLFGVDTHQGTYFNFRAKLFAGVLASSSKRHILALDGPSYNTQHAFARNINSELVHYYWSPQPGWQAENLTHYANIGVNFQFVDQPAVVNGPDNAIHSQHAFARNANSELIHYYWSPQPGWQAENLTQYHNIGPNFRLAGDLAVLNGPSGIAQHAFARNANNELIHYYWSPQPGWQAENLTQYQNIGANFRFADNLAVINGADVAANGPENASQHAFARNANNELIHYYWSPQPGWQAENLTQYPNIGGNFRFASDLAVINSPDNGSQHAFARNANNDLLHYYWSPQPGWQAENLTQYHNIGANFRFADGLVIINGPERTGRSQHAFARNANGELIHYYWSPQPGWQAENLTQYHNIGAGFRFVGDLVVINGPDNNSQHAFARNANNELIHYYWSPQPGWQAENLTQYPNIGGNFRFVGDLTIINGPSGISQHAFARNANGELIHYYWSPQPGWQAENLTQYPNIGLAFRV